jgi:hypothetical protein
MAIVIEEGKKSNNLFAIVGWLVFLAVAAGAAYYIFFAKPELVTIPASGTVSVIAPLTAGGTVDPQSVIQGKEFQSLKSTVTLPTPQGPAAVGGRTNPFTP